MGAELAGETGGLQYQLIRERNAVWIRYTVCSGR
ncbi:hypothetical protein ACVIJW_007167 [Bradyrhizobium barranii subsp. barranii]